MPSNYTGNPATFTDTIPLITGGDAPSAGLWRTPEQLLLNNDVWLKARNADTRNSLQKLRPCSGLTLSDVSSAVAAITISGTGERSVLAIKAGANDVNLVADSATPVSLGSMASIASLVTGVARNGPRLVAIGTGGNNCAFSVNEGQTWAAGSALGAVPKDIIYNPTFSRFMVSFAAGVNVSQDVDGNSTWAAVSTGLTAGQGGLACFSSGATVACGTDGSTRVDFAVSADGGVGWSVAGGTVPNVTDYTTEPGYIAGNGGTTIYHAGRANSNTELRICSSMDGLTWVLRATLPPFSGTTFSAAPKMLVCQSTGMLAVLCANAHAAYGRMLCYVSTDGGVSWAGPAVYTNGVLNRYAVAGGRLFLAEGSSLNVTDELMRAP